MALGLFCTSCFLVLAHGLRVGVQNAIYDLFH